MAFVFTFSISVCFVNSVKTRILIGQQGTERALTWRTRLLTNDTITLNMIKNDSEKNIWCRWANAVHLTAIHNESGLGCSVSSRPTQRAQLRLTLPQTCCVTVYSIMA